MSLLKLFFSLLLTSYFLLLTSSSVNAKDYSFPNVDFKVQINKDGSFDVIENRTYIFDGSFSWADMWIPVKQGNYQFSIINFQISDENGSYQENNSQSPRTYSTKIENDQLYAKWFYSASDQTKTFTISYHVDKGIILHPDVAEFYWKLIGSEWQKGVSSISGEWYCPERCKTIPFGVLGTAR